MASGYHRKSGAIMGIVLDRPSEQIECCEYVPFFPSAVMGKGTQVQIVGAQVTRRPFSGSADLSNQQRRLDHTGDTNRYFVLKLEHVFQ